MAAIGFYPHDSHYIFKEFVLAFGFSTDSKAYNSLLSVRSHLFWIILQYYCSLSVKKVNHMCHLTYDTHDRFPFICSASG